MASRYDAIVIGLGGMGSAAAFHLARRGRRVLGLEQYEMLHERGSSHGLTRIIRLAYHEHPSYVPLLRRSYELWHELEALAGEELLITTGSIEGGPEDGPTFRGSLGRRAAARPAARGAGSGRAAAPLPGLSAPSTPPRASCSSRMAASCLPSAACWRT